MARYKLEVKIGKKWTIGNKFYETKEQAEQVKQKLEVLAKEAKRNHKYKIVEL